jgi:hypothetical protein
MIGSEGMFVIGLMLGVDASPMHALVQGAGTALRMDAKRFRHELEDVPALQRGLNRYLYGVDMPTRANSRPHSLPYGGSARCPLAVDNP